MMKSKSHQILWRKIILEKHMKPGSPWALQRLFKLSGEQTSMICIKDCNLFGLNASRMETLLMMSQTVTHLELHSPGPRTIGPMPTTVVSSWNPRNPRLSQHPKLHKCGVLILDHVVDQNGPLLTILMESSAPSLHTLSIQGLPHTLHPLQQTQFHLTRVKLVGIMDSFMDLVCLILCLLLHIC